jgi:hypothetical protein
VGQIEAVRRLHVFNDELVYEILKTVSQSESYFFKVRKEVFKALGKMEVYTFNKFLSNEAYLLKLFNSKRMLPGDSIKPFYKENDFSNILEYYLDRSLLTAISKSKEEELPLSLDRSKEMSDRMMQRQKQVQHDNHSSELPIEEPSNTNAIYLPIIDNKIQRPKKAKLKFDLREYKCTTDTVARMLKSVLE